MYGVNYVKCDTLRRMREELFDTKKISAHYKMLYNNECRISKNLKKDLLKIQIESRKLQGTVWNLRNEKKKKNIVKKDPRTRRKKNWNELRGQRTKYRRLNDYKDMIFNTLLEIKACHRASINLWLDQNKIQFNWSPSDFREAPFTFERNHGRFHHVFKDHTYSCPDNSSPEHEHMNDIDFAEIYDCDGNWQKLHIRKLVHVMDSYRISHEAYHELRMVSKGHLPPLRRLCIEKKKMSVEIPYIKHPTVRLLNKCTFDIVLIKEMNPVYCLLSEIISVIFW